jgi:hypothetical protein
MTVVSRAAATKRSGAPDGLLSTYLRDHHAGSTAGLRLARRLLRQNQENRYTSDLSSLVDAIASDRQQLIRLMKALDVKPDPIKAMLASSGERLARLKLNGRAFSYSPLSRLTELETLSLGIAGKQALWRSLETASGTAAALTSFDLSGLIDAAGVQLDLVERLRLEAATEAFAASGAP